LRVGEVRSRISLDHVEFAVGPARGSPASGHDPAIREFSITSDGFVLDEAFAELAGRGSS
jgi:hypothetical protein